MPDQPASSNKLFIAITLVVVAVVLFGGVVSMTGVLAAIAIPNFITLQLKAKRGEIPGNVDGIKTAELAYDAVFDHFIATPEAPRSRTEVGKDTVPWRGSPEWTTLGWMPDGNARGVYWVELNGDDDFTVHGVCDVDGDGARAEYTATRSMNATIQATRRNVY